VKESLLSRLRCPACRGRLSLQDGHWEEGEIKEGRLACGDCSETYPVRNYIPRFVGDDDYAVGFGFQWNRHARTQVDKFNGTSISRDRFFAHTRWQSDELAGRQILEAGCGAGRFTQIMLDAGL
jgi:uncharacterized protein YbaR (Trm112 family)